jgi:hypothetical protein
LDERRPGEKVGDSSSKEEMGKDETMDEFESILEKLEPHLALKDHQKGGERDVKRVERGNSFIRSIKTGEKPTESYMDMIDGIRNKGRRPKNPGTALSITQAQPCLTNSRLKRSRSRERNFDASMPRANEGARVKKHREPESTERGRQTSSI